MTDSAHNRSSQSRLSDEEACAIARLTRIVLVSLARIPACAKHSRVLKNALYKNLRHVSISIFEFVFETYNIYNIALNVARKKKETNKKSKEYVVARIERSDDVINE